MLSLRDAVYAIQSSGKPWSARESFNLGFWPSLSNPGQAVSLLAFVARYSAAGANLRTLAAGGGDLWYHISRSQIIPQLRHRLRDPGIIQQNPTGLCGPLAIVVELARRRPAEYVRAVTELLDKGTFTTSGGRIVNAEQELRAEPIVEGPIDEADWILAATMRDDFNVGEDVDDDAYGIESITLWREMAAWTEHILRLGYHFQTCLISGELDAIRKAQAAVNAGGVAFLLIDGFLIKDGGQGGKDNEEDMWWRRARHETGKGGGGFWGPWTHAKDDRIPGDHWAVFLGELELNEEKDHISFYVWSWGYEYSVVGSAEDFKEYLYAVVTGWP